MSIYRDIKFIDEQGRPTSLEYAMNHTLTVQVSEPGLEWTATLRPEDWTETRTNCYCCSCGDREGSDPACRNHGWAAVRPCEEHNMPGSPWDTGSHELGDDVMPDSVQVTRRKEEEFRASQRVERGTTE